MGWHDLRFSSFSFDICCMLYIALYHTPVCVACGASPWKLLENMCSFASCEFKSNNDVLDMNLIYQVSKINWPRLAP